LSVLAINLSELNAYLPIGNYFRASKKRKTMRHKLLPKYLLAAVLALSLFSFAYVNLHAAYACRSGNNQHVKTQQSVLIEEEDNQSSKIPVPDVTIIGRVLDIVQRYTSTNQ